MTLPSAILNADDLLRGRYPAPKPPPPPPPELEATAVGAPDDLTVERAGPETTAGPVPPNRPPEMQIQCGGNLCWAAVIQWLRAWFEMTPLRQCEIAQRHLGRVPLIAAAVSCCPFEGECGMRTGDQCDRRASLEVAMGHLDLGTPEPQPSATVGKTADLLPAPPLPCRFEGRFQHYCVISRLSVHGGAIVTTLLEPISGCEICFEIDQPEFPHPHYDLRCTHFYPMAAAAPAAGGTSK